MKNNSGLYIVDAVCGHVGRGKGVLKSFVVMANNAKEAAAAGRVIPRVKHDFKYAIQNVRKVTLRTQRKGSFFEAFFERGILKDRKEGINNDSDGTLIQFILDEEIFGQYQFNEEFITQLIENYCKLNKGLSIDFELLLNKEMEEYQVKKINSNRTLIEQFKQLEVDLQLSYVQTLTKLKDFRQSELDKLENEKHKLDDELNMCNEQQFLEITSDKYEFQSKIERRNDLTIEIETAKWNICAITETIQKIHTDFFEKTHNNLAEFNNHEITEPVDDLKFKLNTVKKQLQKQGYFNSIIEAHNIMGP